MVEVKIINGMVECFNNGKPMPYIDYIKYSIAMHSGKMENIPSISTSVLENARCKMHAQIKGSICEKCYANTLARLRKGLAEKLHNNTLFYNNVELNDNDIPFLNYRYFRFESFGDLSSVNQFANYCKIAKRNSHCTFVLWTKNPDYVYEYTCTDFNTIPNNLFIIFSSLAINYSQPIDKVKILMPFVSAVFTVYDKAFIKENNIDINCGGRKCSECLRCYTLKKDDIIEVREQLK